MKQFFLLIIILFSFINTFPQNRNNIWYFGAFAAIDFNTNPPTALNNSAMAEQEGSATICDNNGQLLFYTNGVQVWNKNHIVMPNGSGLLGNTSSSQSALIVPQPCSDNIYYIFTTPAEDEITPLCYSVLDMNLNAGLGDIVTKNVPLHTPVTERLTGRLKPNGIDYWVLAQEYNENGFLAYSVTAAGVNPVPVISHSGVACTSILDDLGYMRLSPDGTKLAKVSLYGNGLTELFDFNNNNGIVSNEITLPAFVAYGVDFSPDNSRLYTATANSPFILTQYNLLAGSATAIQNSGVEIANLYIVNGNAEYGGALKIGPDNKIYVNRAGKHYVGVINQPNALGTACNYIDVGIQLGAGSCEDGLPNNLLVYSACSCPSSANNISAITICANQTYQLPSGTIVSAPGTYTDTIRNQAGTCDSIITTIHLSVSTINNVNTNVQLCSNQTYQLPSGTIVNATGIYLDTIRSLGSCDSVITTVNLSVLPVSLLNINAQICSNHTYQLPSGTIVNVAGIYIDTLRSITGCDSIITHLNLSVFPVDFLNTEINICSNQTYQLPSGTIVGAAGFYMDTTISVNSCDSIINNIHLLVNNISSTNIIDSIYEGEPYHLPSGQTINIPGTYQTVLVNSLGCDSVITTILTLRKQIAECLTLKNAFTPNGDGINDYWVLYKYFCFKKLEVNVYNRYGSLVYHSDDYENDWNGKYKNKELPDGTYYYIIKVISYDGKEHLFKDNVTIIR